MAVKVKHHANIWTQCVCTTLLVRLTLKKKNHAGQLDAGCLWDLLLKQNLKKNKKNTMQSICKNVNPNQLKHKMHYVGNLHFAASSTEINWEHELSCIFEVCLQDSKSKQLNIKQNSLIQGVCGIFQG